MLLFGQEEGCITRSLPAEIVSNQKLDQRLCRSSSNISLLSEILLTGNIAHRRYCSREILLFGDIPFWRYCCLEILLAVWRYCSLEILLIGDIVGNIADEH